MQKRRWRLGIFDWDGTLWNSIDLAYRSHVHACKKYGIDPLPFEMWRDTAISDFIKVYRRKGLPKNVIFEEFSKISHGYFNARWKTVSFYPGADELVRLCEKFTLFRVVVSGQNQNIIANALGKSNFHHFGCINNIHGNVRDKKGALVETLDDWGEKAGDAFYLDDTYEGLAAARELGITAIGVTYGLNSGKLIRKARPHFTADSLYDVMEIIKNGGKR